MNSVTLLTAGALLIATNFVLQDHFDQDEQPSYRPPKEYSSFEFSLDDWPDANFYFELHVERHEAEALIDALELESIKYRRRIQPTPAFALCVTLARLHYPNTWSNHIDKFGRSATYLSVVFNDVMLHISRRFHKQITWHPQLRNYQRLKQFGRAVYNSGAYGMIWGFIDGHFMEFSRPGKNQRIMYSGHTKRHGLKFQAITTPDGLVSSLIGPFVGKTNDWQMYKDSRVPRRLQRSFQSREPLYIYGDPAYNNSYGVMSPYQHPGGDEMLTPSQKAFNAEMSKLRVSVEHSFGEVWRKWTYLSFGKSLRHGKQALGSYYRAAVFITNCLTCIRGRNQTALKYSVPPPTLEEYTGQI